jgi:uncharacterized metal-binding protein YceD (DUF177 family)
MSGGNKKSAGDAATDSAMVDAAISAEPAPLLWPRPVIVDRFGPRPFEMKLSTDAQERAHIAIAYDLQGVEELGANLTLTRKGSRLKVVGKVTAKVTQRCIITLEPVQSRVSETLDLTFAPPASVRGGKGRHETQSEETLQMDVEDPPELILDGTVDLGAAMLEFFALGLDPYPRKAGAEFAEKQVSDPVEHPFAALARLKVDK